MLDTSDKDFKDIWSIFSWKFLRSTWKRELIKRKNLHQSLRSYYLKSLKRFYILVSRSYLAPFL